MSPASASPPPSKAYGVRFTVARSLEPDPLAEYVFGIHGKVQVGDDLTEEVVGHVAARVLFAGRALEDGQKLLHVFDAVEDSLYECHAALFDRAGDALKPSVSDGALGVDVLLVDRLELVASHRGKRLGQFAMLRLIETFGHGCAVAALRPVPLQFETDSSRASPQTKEWKARIALDRFDQNEQRASLRLRTYWEELGFERVGRSEFLALDLQRKRPSVVDLASTGRPSRLT